MPLTPVYLIDPISFHRGNIRDEFSSIEIFPPRVIGMSRNSSFRSLSGDNLSCKFSTDSFFYKILRYFVVEVDADKLFKREEKLKRKIFSFFELIR